MLALSPLPGLAQQAPSNSVRCVDQALTVEDREIALVLMFVRYGDSRQDRVYWLRGVAVAARLLDAARAQCQKVNGWTAAKSQHARDYAFRTLLVDIIRQRLESEGAHLAGPIDRYFASHGNKLERKLDPESDQGKDFTAYLLTQGWDAEAEDDLRTARSYLDALRERGESERRFAAEDGA